MNFSARWSWLEHVTYQKEREHLVLVRMLLAQDRPGPATALLDRLYSPAAALGRIGSVIEIQALQALALAADGDEAAAVNRLAGALTLACPQGYVRVYADEGAPRGVLLGQLVVAQRAGHAAARGVPLGCLARVLQAFGQQHAEPGPRPRTAAAVPGLVEQLTDASWKSCSWSHRVRRARPSPNSSWSPSTPSRNTSPHLLAKLGAANRTEAPRPRAAARPDPLTRRPGRSPRRLSARGWAWRFHLACHLRVTPHGGTATYRPSKNQGLSRSDPRPLSFEVKR
jgi:MalT-like TPR region